MYRTKDPFMVRQAHHERKSKLTTNGFSLCKVYSKKKYALARHDNTAPYDFSIAALEITTRLNYLDTRSKRAPVSEQFVFCRAAPDVRTTHPHSRAIALQHPALQQ